MADIILNNPVGIWAFLALIPFIIIYLRRPKILTKSIPSLMFLMRQEGMDKRHQFFRRLMTSLLFLIQLLILCLLAFGVAAPYAIAPDVQLTRNTVIIIDGSASMQAKQEASTRFDQAIAMAKSRLSGTNSVIMAGNSIAIPLKDGSSSAAAEALNALKPDDAATNLEAAMRAADALLEGKKAHVYVFSDFITAKGIQDDPLKAKRILTSKGNIVDFVDLSNDADNAGIIDLNIDKETTEVSVKNYNQKPKDIKLSLVWNGQVVLEYTKNIMANSVEILSFPTQEGKSQIQLEPADDLAIDNIAYISTPLNKHIKVMLITNKESPYLIC